MPPKGADEECGQKSYDKYKVTDYGESWMIYNHTSKKQLHFHPCYAKIKTPKYKEGALWREPIAESLAQSASKKRYCPVPAVRQPPPAAAELPSVAGTRVIRTA